MLALSLALAKYSWAVDYGRSRVLSTAFFNVKIELGGEWLSPNSVPSPEWILIKWLHHTSPSLSIWGNSLEQSEISWFLATTYTVVVRRHGWPLSFWGPSFGAPSPFLSILNHLPSCHGCSVSPIAPSPGFAASICRPRLEWQTDFPTLLFQMHSHLSKPLSFLRLYCLNFLFLCH